MKIDRFKTGIVFVCLFILLFIGARIASQITHHAWIRILLYGFLSAYFVYCLFTLALWILVQHRKKICIQSNGEDILIVAPHQDDCVAIAGGYAIQTKEMGGRVRVLYVTDGEAHDKAVRKREALNAWAVIGLRESELHFLRHETLNGLTTKDEIESCIEEIFDFIKKDPPDTIFIPLYEGGHFQHDTVNYMVSQAVKRCNFKGRVFESPEYNFYLSLKTTPEKILSGFMRFIPLVRYDYPPEPILDDATLHLKMTPLQQKIKIEMLSKFATQHPEMLKVRFGFEDRYQILHAYDYNLPPFDYRRSIARIQNTMKTWPCIGGMVSKMFKWTKTIHPDPRYVMTAIPQRAKGAIRNTYPSPPIILPKRGGK